MTTKLITTVEDIESRFGRVSFGQALQAWRVCDELSLREMAQILGITAASLHDMEKGRRIPSPARAAKIAHKLGHPITTWVELALQDLLHKEKLRLKIKLEAA